MTATAYDAANNPTTVTTDPGGLNLRKTTAYDAATGLVTATRMPSNPAGGDASEIKTVYYRAGTGSGDGACDSKPQWANLVCKELPAVQPSVKLPETTYTYNRLNQVVTQVDSVPGGPPRTTAYGYDTAGRQRSEAITGTADAGSPVASVTSGYDPATGRQTTLTSSDGKTLSTVFDSLGRVTSYTDAEGNVSTASYDVLDRPVTTGDGKGSQTRGYDPTTGDLTSLVDSRAGSFTAVYDADGRPVGETLPGGVEVVRGFDETGAAVSLSYTKNAVTWFSQQVVESAGGQWRSDSSTAAGRVYGYDRAGRLTDVQDRPAGGGCTTRSYSYDANSNRLARTERPPAGDGGCQTTGTAPQQTNSFDSADRQVDSGFVYDGFGRQTQVPGAAAGGGALSQSYYVNDLLRSQTEDGQSNVWALDPARRQRANSAAGDGTSQRLHYTDSSDSPAWTETLDPSGSPAGWSRNVTGIGGELAATVTDSGQGPAVALQLANLRGDIVAAANPAAAAPTQSATCPQREKGGM